MADSNQMRGRRRPDPGHAGQVTMLIVMATATFVLIMAVPAAASWLAPASGVQAWQANPGSGGCCAMVDLLLGNNVGWFASEKAFAASTTTPPPAVLYDIEPWTFTPLAERQHPIQAMRAFVALAHERGEQAILSPSAQLTKFAVGECAPRSHEDPHDAAFRCGLFAVKGDYLLVQSQRRECDPSMFSAWLQRVARVARSKVMAELTVVWADPCVTADNMMASYRAALPYVSDFALWYGCNLAGTETPPCIVGARDLASQAQIGAEFLTQVGA